MSADKKPVWLDDQAHTILKEYAKLIKKSATDVTSDLVIQHLASLEEGAQSAPAAQASPAVEVAAPAAPAAPAPVEEPARYVEVSAKEIGETRRATQPVVPKRERKPRKDDGQVRYLGGVKFY